MLRNRLNDALKDAMRAKDRSAVSTLRLILAALKDRDIAARTAGRSEGVEEEEILQILQKMVRQRHEAIEMYRKADRQDLVEQEQAEIAVIERFLPRQLDEQEMRGVVNDTIEELDAGTIKDMGRVMGALKERYAGRMDFGKASAMVKEQLT
jgi:uncharacterized protein YqeY